MINDQRKFVITISNYYMIYLVRTTPFYPPPTRFLDKIYTPPLYLAATQRYMHHFSFIVSLGH